MQVSIELNSQAKLYEVRAEGMYAFYDAIEQHEAWVAITALTWQKILSPETPIHRGEGVPTNILHQGRMLLSLLEEKGFTPPGAPQG